MAMKTTLCTITIAATVLLTSAAPAAENPWIVYTEWPFDATEAKRRQQETADAMDPPVYRQQAPPPRPRLGVIPVPGSDFSFSRE